MDTASDDGRTALHVAAEYGRGTVILTLLEHGADVSAKPHGYGGWHDRKFYGNRIALHWAAAGGHRYAIQCLLKFGADVGAFNASLRTPLQDAIMHGRTAAAKLLLENGAPIDCADDQGYTPLHEAASGGHVEVAEILLDREPTLKHNAGLQSLLTWKDTPRAHR